MKNNNKIWQPALKTALTAWFFCTGLMWLSPSVGYAANPKIQICAAEDHVFHQMATQTLIEAYQRIGYDVEFTWLPNRRSLIEANAGTCGGEMMRISGANRKFTNLIAVKVPIAYLEGVAFMKHAQEQNTPPIKKWEDLQNLGTYIILGELYAEHATHDMNVGQVRTYKQLFTMLEKGHIDVGIGIREVGMVELAHHFSGSDIHIHGDVLARSPMYHYVHKNNQFLIKELEVALKDMERTGEIKNLNSKVLGHLMTKP